MKKFLIVTIFAISVNYLYSVNSSYRKKIIPKNVVIKNNQMNGAEKTMKHVAKIASGLPIDKPSNPTGMNGLDEFGKNWTNISDTIQSKADKLKDALRKHVFSFYTPFKHGKNNVKSNLQALALVQDDEIYDTYWNNLVQQKLVDKKGKFSWKMVEKAIKSTEYFKQKDAAYHNYILGGWKLLFNKFHLDKTQKSKKKNKNKDLNLRVSK